jgi:hypothetical protein
MKRIRCKEEHNKTNTNFTTQERGKKNKSKRKKEHNKTNNNFTTQEGQKQIKLEKV